MINFNNRKIETSQNFYPQISYEFFSYNNYSQVKYNKKKTFSPIIISTPNGQTVDINDLIQDIQVTNNKTQQNNNHYTYNKEVQEYNNEIYYNNDNYNGEEISEENNNEILYNDNNEEEYINEQTIDQKDENYERVNYYEEQIKEFTLKNNKLKTQLENEKKGQKKMEEYLKNYKERLKLLEIEKDNLIKERNELQQERINKNKINKKASKIIVNYVYNGMMNQLILRWCETLKTIFNDNINDTRFKPKDNYNNEDYYYGCCDTNLKKIEKADFVQLAIPFKEILKEFDMTLGVELLDCLIKERNNWAHQRPFQEDNEFIIRRCKQSIDLISFLIDQLDYFDFVLDEAVLIRTKITLQTIIDNAQFISSLKN
ncbi:hypothetical protein ABK040_004239 [Willaertia magna]